ncbi:MAG TPA: DNA mismatch repair endonuclease MutL [Dehalococcoidia bacterium]|nr:DNA mismatch repair endonuclease MutL [Dehalococcoidia bacterium]
MPIRVLPREVVERIAAGEVVERPASVVKELVENALDAGARRIAVEVRGGGLELVRVTDDGCGVQPEELELAFARHATSKVACGDDLLRIATLGFRGEALPSIAAVADVEMASRPSGAEVGHWLRLEEGRPVARGQRGMASGTVVSVWRLFARHPGRRKFLRSAASESSLIAQVVSHYALAYPEVRFLLVVDGRTALSTPGSGSLRDAVAAVYGPQVASALLTVGWEREGVRVEGVVSPPQLSRASRTYQSFFVNRRWVQNRRLSFALEEAYQGLLPSGRHPIAVLDVRLPPEAVDVNVHPTKAEVRFQDEHAVLSAVARAVREALLAGAPVARAPMAAAPSPPPPADDVPSAPPLWAVAAPTAPGGAPTPRRALPLLRVVGQVANLYIVAEGPDGMYLIDQHAAHERVLYEEVMARRQGRGPVSQGLLTPVTVELSPAQEALLRECWDALAANGFLLEAFGERGYLLRAVPALLEAHEAAGSLLAVLDRMAQDRPPAGVDRVAAAVACHAAVRAGKVLSLEEMRELVRRLEETEAPHTCPHGRPTMLQLRAEELAKGFGRR